MVVLEVFCGNEWPIKHLLQNSVVNRSFGDYEDQDTNRFFIDDTNKAGPRLWLSKFKMPSLVSFRLLDVLRSHAKISDLQRMFSLEKPFPGCGPTKVRIVLTKANDLVLSVLPNYSSKSIDRTHGYKIIRPCNQKKTLLWYT